MGTFRVYKSGGSSSGLIMEYVLRVDFLSWAFLMTISLRSCALRVILSTVSMIFASLSSLNW